MKKKKIFATLLAAAMTMSMLAGCGNQDAPAGNSGDAGNDGGSTQEQQSEQETEQESQQESDQEEVQEQVLKVAAFEGGYGSDMWHEVVAAFEASHPGVKVELTIDKKLEDVISPGMKAGDYPDVVHLATGREAALTETLTKENALLPLTDVLEMTVPGESVKVKDKIVSGFTDTLATNPYGDGVTYYAPMFYSPCGLFYNAGLFKEKNWEVLAVSMKCLPIRLILEVCPWRKP